MDSVRSIRIDWVFLSFCLSTALAFNWNRRSPFRISQRPADRDLTKTTATNLFLRSFFLSNCEFCRQRKVLQHLLPVRQQPGHALQQVPAGRHADSDERREHGHDVRAGGSIRQLSEWFKAFGWRGLARNLERGVVKWTRFTLVLSRWYFWNKKNVSPSFLLYTHTIISTSLSYRDPSRSPVRSFLIWTENCPDSHSQSK